MGDFKGNEYFNNKLHALTEVFQDMETPDALVLLTALSCETIIHSTTETDLEVARQILNILRGAALSQLADNGWE